MFRLLKLIYGITLAFTMAFNSVQIYQYVTYIQYWDNMDKESFWKVFFRTSDEYQGLLWRAMPVMTDNHPINCKNDTLFKSNSFVLDKKNPFSPGLATPLNKVAGSLRDTSYFFVNAKIKPLANPRGKIHWAISVQKDNNFSFEKIFDIEILPLYKNHWYRISKLLVVPKPLHVDDFLKIFLWNSSECKIAADSLIIERIVCK